MKGVLYMMKPKTLKNKLYSIALVSLGALSVPIDGDATAFVLLLMLGIPLFFAKENYIK